MKLTDEARKKADLTMTEWESMWGAEQNIRGAEGGTRTPMPLRAQRPERCVSTNFTTSAGWLFVRFCPRQGCSGGHGLYYCIRCDLSRGFVGYSQGFFVKILFHVPWLVVRTCYNMFALFLLYLSFLWAIFLSARRLEGICVV